MKWLAARSVALCVVVLACGREGPSSGPQAGVAACFTLDGGGGTVELGRVTLVIPPGALAAPTTITVREAPDSTWGAVGPVFELGPDGLSFAVAPTLSIAYDESELPPGVKPEALRVAVREHGSWRHLPDGEHRADERSAAAKLEHFSLYTLAPLADEISGVGDHFELNGIVVDTSAEVFARLSVAPTIINLALGRGTDAPVDIALSGLPTDGDHYVFLGSYEQSQIIRPADGGTLTVTTTLESPKVLWVEPGPGTTIISDDPAKDQCATVGVRVDDTCRLTTDVVGSIEIISPDQTLDCDGHAIVQTTPKPSAGVGIAVGSEWANLGGAAPVNVTVRNCIVGGATWAEAFGIGLQGWSIQGLRVENCTFDHDRTGIQVGPGAGATLVGNTISGALDVGISVVGPANTNDIRDNHVTMAIGANIQPTALRLAGQMHKAADGSFLPDAVTNTTASGNVFGGEMTCGIGLSVAAGNTIHENDLVGPDVGLRLDGEGSWPNVFYHNNVTALTFGVNSTIGPVELGWASRGSYWGHSCTSGPLFTPGADSNRTDVVDAFPYGAANAWAGGGVPGCGGADTTPPDAPTIDRPIEGEIVNEPRPRVIGHAEGGSTVRILEGGALVAEGSAASDGNFAVQVAFAASSGLHVIVATAVDAAGNESDPSPPRSFAVVAPTDESPILGEKGKLAVVAIQDFPDPMDPERDLAALHVGVEVEPVAGLHGASSNHEFDARLTWITYSPDRGAIVNADAVTVAVPAVADGEERASLTLGLSWDGQNLAGESVAKGQNYPYDVSVVLVKNYVGEGTGPRCGRDEVATTTETGNAACIVDKLRIANAGTLVVANAPECPPGGVLLPCRGRCVALATDPENCGTCGVRCPPGMTCALGVCRPGGSADPEAGDLGCGRTSAPTRVAGSRASSPGESSGIPRSRGATRPPPRSSAAGFS